MFEPWILLSIMAALFQTLRFMLQKSLSMGTLSALGATFARFAYAAPLAACTAFGYTMWLGEGLPQVGSLFWLYVLSGGLAQILATWCVVLLFAERNFAVGITFKKTEVIQTALVGLIILGDHISLPAFFAIFLGLIGVLVLSDPPEGATKWTSRFVNRAAGLGLVSGAFFAISAVTYRGATLEVASDDAFLRAMLSVAAVTASQTFGMALYLRWKEPSQLSRVWAARAKAIWMGFTSLLGSVGWFTAFTLQNAAYVFAVGQVEVIFSIMASVLFFKEKITSREVLGMALLSASIIALVALG
ncbi:DMT family transporter [Roseovarius rhodophyticola]|uniref:DMT family transporter n=1 Tax=Roseovarius rhodophyticola TaxID=3080827 RepID=A0ABZ2TKL4_9RHOB|nr:DMT family transporter [Roseovarius sp. W115]MDV2929253.1 DMT family transporter [Roseovarius sp. W115]